MSNPDAVSRQQRVGAASRHETRERLLRAATDEFAAHGYVAATVARISAAAGVSVQTLYLAWGSKRALLRASLERSLVGGRGSPSDVTARFLGKTPEECIATLGTTVAGIAARASTGWALYRDAAAVDADIAADWDHLQRLRRETVGEALSQIPAQTLRDGLTADEAADTAWVITSPESYDLLVERLGYSHSEFAEWMTRTLTAALLKPAR